MFTVNMLNFRLIIIRDMGFFLVNKKKTFCKLYVATKDNVISQ